MENFFAEFALLVLFAVAPVNPNAPGAHVEGPRVLLAGDSQIGTGFPGALAKPASLRQYPWELQIVSVPGSALLHTAYWQPHLDMLLKHQRDVVILDLGTNDALDGDFGVHWLETPYKALQLLRQVPGYVPVIFIAPPPDLRYEGNDLRGQAAWVAISLSWAAQQRGEGTARVSVLVPPAGATYDGVHYSIHGSEQVAAMVYAEAEALLDYAASQP